MKSYERFIDFDDTNTKYTKIYIKTPNTHNV